MKKRYLYTFILLLIFLITGCTKNNTRKDIIKYVKKELNLSDISVSKTYKESIDKDGNTDKIWTVTDKTNNIKFHVLDDYYYSNENILNHLLNDYDESIFIVLYDNMDIKQNIIYDYESNEKYNKINLICNYSNKDELDDCYNSLLSYKKYIESQNFNLAIQYLLIKIDEYEYPMETKAGTLNNLE